MSILKKLAGQTVIYGLSSIIGRFLNYLLVPLHTTASVFSPEQYGVITEMYAYVAFLIILLTYGMETAFFRFSSQPGANHAGVFKTALNSVTATTVVFIAVAIVFAQPIADWLRYSDRKEFVVWFAIIVGLDAVASLPLARLRAQNKAKTFALINVLNVLVNIGMNVLFLLWVVPQGKAGGTDVLTRWLYIPEMGVGYVFIANLTASAVKFLVLLPVMLSVHGRFDRVLLREMLIYALPLLLAGLAGMINETIDRILLKRVLWDIRGEAETLRLVGIYGANYKLSIVISLMIQAFRYAAEPFFFNQQSNTDAPKLYAHVLNWFTLALTSTFLGVMLYIDVFKLFIRNPEYWIGLRAVPVLLLANIFLGIYYNQSVWYKLTGKTAYGAWLALGGAVITIAINVVLIPSLDYMASAWATFFCYGFMMVASYALGQRFYPVPYRPVLLLGLIASAVLVWQACVAWAPPTGFWHWAVATIIIGAYAVAGLLAVRKWG